MFVSCYHYVVNKDEYNNLVYKFMANNEQTALVLINVLLRSISQH